jgi:hypothetical protein
MLPPHIKRKKYKIKFYTLPHETTTQKREKSLTMQQRKKRERRRRKKEEGRKLRPTVQSQPALIWLATETVGGVSPALFFSFSLVFFFPVGIVFSWFLG